MTDYSHYMDDRETRRRKCYEFFLSLEYNPGDPSSPESEISEDLSEILQSDYEVDVLGDTTRIDLLLVTLSWVMYYLAETAEDEDSSTAFILARTAHILHTQSPLRDMQ